MTGLGCFLLLIYKSDNQRFFFVALVFYYKKVIYELVIYSGNKAEDVVSIWSFCWKHFLIYGMEPGEHLADAKGPILQIVDDMYDEFPSGNIRHANPFKLCAWFATCFLYYRPLQRPLVQKITEFDNEQNAVVAYNAVVHSLLGCQIYKENGETSTICDLPDKMLSKHSYEDVIKLLLEWERFPIQKKGSDNLHNFYHCLALLLEQITYRTLPAISYPRQIMLPSTIVGD